MLFHIVRKYDIIRMKEWSMARKKRIWYEGASYHVKGRGNRRDKIFYDDDDYDLFMKTLLYTKERYSFYLHVMRPGHNVRSPHHNVSLNTLIGGGADSAMSQSTYLMNTL